MISRTSPSRFIQLASLCLVFISSQAALGQAGASVWKIYRGAIGDKHVEMKLKIGGNRVSGSYFYDQFKQDLQLTGEYDAKGGLELTETGKKGKPTGKFVCKKEPGLPDTDLYCEWSRPDGTGKILASLTEQFVDFQKGSQLVPKTIITRSLNINASYPQLTGAAISSPSASAFNSRIEGLAQKAVKDYSRDASPGGSFDLNYNVMLGTDDLVSMEINEEVCCAAHPTESVSALTYDLVANKEVVLDELFKSDADYKTAIAGFVVSDINKRAEQTEREEAERQGRKVEKRQEPFLTTDSLPEMSSWAITPKGVAVYFDFPHAMAIFTKTIVPFNVLRDQLKPDGLAARFTH